jgi:hypothetical protein
MSLVVFQRIKEEKLTYNSIRKSNRYFISSRKSSKKCFLQIILIWLIPATTSVRCIITYESTRKHFCFTKKHLKFDKKTLLLNHPHLATSYTSIGLVDDNLCEYSKALSYFEGALNILQDSLPSNHPAIQNVRQRIKIIRKKL